MSTESRDLINLVEKLRQEQEFVSFYKSQIRQSVQDLNTCCDNVFHSLWLSHTLSYGLHMVLTHHLHCFEWSLALEQAKDVEFVNASKVLKSHTFVERYSTFLSSFHSDPKLLSEILYLAESEGLDCNWLVSDLMSVVYGHCVFHKDHILFLQLMRELLKKHISCCDSPKDLFSGVESVFNKVLSEYCSQLVELRTFLTEVLQEPIMAVLNHTEYLEYDINKAGNRIQQTSELTGTLIDSSVFLFTEDLDSSCEQLAKLAMQFLTSLSRMLSQLPLSFKWLLGSLKTLVRQKWPKISPPDIRRPISDAVFGSIFSSAIVNPDSCGILNPQIVITPVGRYNLTQITSVLQGCAWILDKPSGSKYPIHKVVKRMDVNLLSTLMDTIDGGYSEELPDLPSSLPGLKRSAFLASQSQLNNLVGLVASLLVSKVGSGNFHAQLYTLFSSLLPAMVEMGSKTPYSIPTTVSLLRPSLSFTNEKSPPSSTSTGPWRGKQNRNKEKKNKSGGNSAMLGVDVGKTLPGTVPRRSTISVISQSDVKSVKLLSEKGLNPSPSREDSIQDFELVFQLPKEVLILPILDQSGDIPYSTQWDFDLLSEEEFMGNNRSTTPLKMEEQRKQCNFTPLSPVPTPTDTFMALAMDTGNQATTNDVLSLSPSNSILGTSAPGTVRNMIHRIEVNERVRSNTLPLSPTPSYPVQINKRPTNKSEGGTPIFNGSPTSTKKTPSHGVVHDSSWMNGKAVSSKVESEMTSDEKVHTDLFSPVFEFPPGLERSSPLVNGDTHSGGGSSRHNSPIKLTSPITKKPPPINVVSMASANGENTLVGKAQSHSNVSTSGYIEMNSPQRKKLDETTSTSSGYILMNEARSIANHLPVRPDPVYLSEDAASSVGLTSEQGEEKSILSSSPRQSPNPDISSNASTHSSIEMLIVNDDDITLDEAERMRTRSHGKKGFRNQLKKLFKRRKSSEVRVKKSGGGDWEVSSRAQQRKERSKSEVSTSKTRIDSQLEGKELLPKQRSKSDQRILQEDSPSPIRRSPVKRSYTLLTKDITDKYKYAALQARKKKNSRSRSKSSESLLSDSETVDSVKQDTDEQTYQRLDSTPSAELTPQRYRHSLYCDQLKYKLRAALQNIHTPLSLSPVYMQLCVDEDAKCDSRYQLILLIHHALQRSRWKHNEMEIALLTELLKMVEPLPNELAQATVEGVYEDYHSRSAYVAYLVKSQQKFQDTKLQVAAVQSAVDRTMHTQEELFVNFAVRLFLENQESDMKQFMQRMKGLYLSDEKCSLMERYLVLLTDTIRNENTWSSWVNIEQVLACLETYVFAQVYDDVFHPNGNGESDVMRDQIFSQHLSQLSEFVTVTHKSLQIPFVYHNGCPWMSAQKHLKSMAVYKSPRGKLNCIVQSCKVLISLLQYAKCGDPPGADDLFPVLVYILIKSNPAGLLSTVQYIRNFTEDNLIGEDAYWWAQFSTAVEFTKTLE